MYIYWGDTIKLDSSASETSNTGSLQAMLNQNNTPLIIELSEKGPNPVIFEVYSYIYLYILLLYIHKNYIYNISYIRY